MAEAITLRDADPSWPALFAAERALMLPCFAEPPLLIEHMGSTAIADLPAKPIIDIIVLVATLDTARSDIPALEALGYSFWADNPDKTKLFLVKGLPPALQRTHHLHIYDTVSEVERHLLFRDLLRANADVRNAYLALKQDLAARFRDDREVYSNGKTAFIDAAIAHSGGARRVAPASP